MELPADAVGPESLEGDLGLAPGLARYGVEAGQGFGAGVSQGLEDVLQPGSLEIEQRLADHGLQRRVGVGEPAGDVELVDAVRRLLHDVLVAGPVGLLPADDRRPVALGQGVGQAIEGRQHPGEEQGQCLARPLAPRLGDLHRRLDDEVAGDPQHHQQLGQGAARPGRRGADLAQVLEQRLVDVVAGPGDGQDGLEAGGGLVDEALLLLGRPDRRLGHDRLEDVEGPAGHLGAAPLERLEQLGGVGVVGDEDGRPAVGVAGQEALEVGDGERRAGAVVAADLEVAGGGQRPDRFDGQAEEIGRLGQIHQPLAGALGDVRPPSRPS